MNLKKHMEISWYGLDNKPKFHVRKVLGSHKENKQILGNRYGKWVGLKGLWSWWRRQHRRQVFLNLSTVGNKVNHKNSSIWDQIKSIPISNLGTIWADYLLTRPDPIRTNMMFKLIKVNILNPRVEFELVFFFFHLDSI